jgi:thiol-disulfide isomerase/thioredoxin
MKKQNLVLILVLLFVLLTSACGSISNSTDAITAKQDAASEEVGTPVWFEMPLTDVRTGQTITISELSNKVVLVETMAMWCPTCLKQELEVQKMHNMLGERDDLISIAIDIDSNENADALNDYIDEHDFDWFFVVASPELKRDIGNHYGANFLTPPAVPLLIIDRYGDAYGLPYGLKKAESLSKTLQTFLDED